MRRSTSLLITLVALCGSMLVASPSVVAQGPSPDSPCVGSWMWRVTGLGEPEFTAYALLLADGGFHTERAPVVAGPADAPENVTFPAGGYGAWEPTEDGGCAVTFVSLNADPQGNVLNTVEISFVLDVGPDGQTISSRLNYATVTAPDGTVLFEGSGGTLAGTRVVVKLPPSPAPSPAPAASAAP